MPLLWRRSGEDAEAILLGDDGRFPNSVSLPLLVYPRAFDPDAVSPELIEEIFAANSWPPVWRGTVFSDHHYHSTAHEGLGAFAGSATLLFGGPEGLRIDVRRGDAVVIPAGVAHATLRSSEDFMLVGAYPAGQHPDLLWGRSGERPAADSRIAAVPAPGADPVRGTEGPLDVFWLEGRP